MQIHNISKDKTTVKESNSITITPDTFKKSEVVIFYPGYRAECGNYKDFQREMKSVKTIELIQIIEI